MEEDNKQPFTLFATNLPLNFCSFSVRGTSNISVRKLMVGRPGRPKLTCI